MINKKIFNNINKKGKGFTLLELLIVIAILAILSVVTVLVLNPAETLKKARDVQRISDLDVLKTALGLYMTTVSSPWLGSTTSNDTCAQQTAGGTAPTVYLSQAGGTTVAAVYGAGATTVGSKTYETTPWIFASSDSAVVSGAGWLPVDFTKITGGSPISNLPRDPNPDVTTAGEGATQRRRYTYACDDVDSTFELTANLESSAFSSGGTDNKEGNDGGDNANLFEKGTELNILLSNGY